MTKKIDGSRIGHIDLVTSDEISGWYRNLTDVNPRKLLFYADGVLFDEVVARDERNDVKASGLTELECGFYARLPSVFSSARFLAIYDATDDVCVWVIDMKTKSAQNNLMTGEIPNANLPTVVSKSWDSNDSCSDHLNIIFDVSDLVYYVGHHDNLTGIQRVQSCVIQALARSNLIDQSNTQFIAYDADQSIFQVIDRRSFLSLLEDLSRPLKERNVYFDKFKARVGSLFPVGKLEMSRLVGENTVISLLGAAWVVPDYAHKIRLLKREYGVRFVPTFHDLIPIYAKETCDQGTAEVFKVFLDQICSVVDVALCVSDNTSRDLIKYCEDNKILAPPTIVTKNGSSFEEFFPIMESSSSKFSAIEGLVEEPYVLFVSTIEGRKNHLYAFRIWEHLYSEGVKLPRVICVGRLGWRSEEFLQSLIRTDYLHGLFEIVEDISDDELKSLYQGCMFSIYPSKYEGWGLPIGECLSYGKACVLTSNSSLPEVAGEAGIYIPEDDVVAASNAVRKLIEKPSQLKIAEKKVGSKFSPVSWGEVAKSVIKGCRQAIDLPPSGILPDIEFGAEYTFRRLRIDTSNLMGQRMMDVLLSASQGNILEKQVADQNKLLGLQMRDGPWYEPEEWGCWARGMTAGLRIGLKPSALTGDLSLYLSAQVPAQYTGSSIGLLTDAGEPLGDRSIAKPIGLYCWHLPFELIHKRSKKAPNGFLDFSLRFELSEVSSEKRKELQNIDTRDLGIGIRSVLFLQSEDTENRLNILESLFFEHNR